ncbi:MAG: Smr/MutS family protein [Spirochaetales bacterium]|nr:Smr/MutS family protein [Spirochaetales bacterium]MDY5915593.1 Smr/MutS family protein [Treponema sp.]
MNKKTLTQIDYYRIRDEIAEYCVSQEGKKNILEREPFKDIEEIEKNKNLSREWEKYFSKNYSNPLFGWENIKNLLPIIKMNGSSLTLEQVNNLGHFILSVNNVKKAIENHKIELELTLLPEQIYQIPDLQDAEKKIFRVISTDGQMKELPEIVDIRKQIASLNSKIKTIMQGFTSNSKFHGVLESQVPVLRNGRQVLAVKASLQNRVPGIIHEVSQTAQTVFVEPQEAVLCSNELLQKEFELQAVIKKILTELTQSLQPSIPLFRDALPVMCLLDTTQAAQRWGNEHNCCYAQNAINEPPMLINARHPLLGEKAVPIDIKFMSEKKVLIITGPNTGGKTVSLKTFALLSMLNQSGFPIPADEGTRLPVFSNVFADIGDDQSLDQSLSTFSGHMKNIAQAVNSATDKTLILLDELGSGTDPQEGTAIAMAVLDKLIEKKSFVLVTTHQGILKNYGYTNEYCINASVEFNQNTLSPNYHLLMGVPGESHALDIAKKSGLPSEICKAAQDYILTEQADVSALIRGLNKKHIELNKIQKQNEKLLSENQEKFEKLKKKELELRRKENELKKGKQQELNDFLIHSRRQLENLVRTLKEGEITREKTLAVKQFINDLTKNTEHLEQKIEAEEEKLAKDEQDFAKQIASKNHHTSTKKTKRKMSNSEALKYASPLVTQIENSDFPKKSVAIKTNAVFEPGAYVIAGTNNSEGILIEETRKGVWQVQFGSVKMSVKQKDLRLSDNQERTLTPSVSIDINSKEVNGNIIVEKDIPRPVFELRLLGMRSEEALRSLERQIDLCLLNNFLHFSVIHGKGDGILQQVVQDYLSHSSVVASFEFAPAEDGGAGKTYVTLKG